MAGKKKSLRFEAQINIDKKKLFTDVATVSRQVKFDIPLELKFDSYTKNNVDKVVNSIKTKLGGIDFDLFKNLKLSDFERRLSKLQETGFKHIGEGLKFDLDNLNKAQDQVNKIYGVIVSMAKDQTKMEMGDMKHFLQNDFEDKYKDIDKEINVVRRSLSALRKEMMESGQGINGNVLNATIDKAVNSYKTLKREVISAYQTQVKLEREAISSSMDSAIAFEKRAEEIKGMSKEIKSTTFDTDKDGKLRSAIISYTDGFGNLTKETMSWVQYTSKATGEAYALFEVVDVKMTSSVQKIGEARDEAKKSITDMNRGLEELKTKGIIDNSEIEDFKKTLDSINTDVAENEIDAMNDKITLAENRMKEMVKAEKQFIDISKTLDSNTFNLNGLEDFDKLKEQIPSYQALIDAQKELKSLQAQTKSGGVADTNRLTIANNELAMAWKKVKDEHSQASNQAKKDTSDLVKSETQYLDLVKKIADLENKRNKLKNENKNTYDSQVQGLKKFETALGELYVLLEKTSNKEVIDGNALKRAVNEGAIAFSELETATKEATREMTRVNKEGDSLGQSFKKMFERVGMGAIAFRAIDMIGDSFRDGINAIKEFDSALTTLKITMDGMTSENLNGMITQSKELATNLSTTTTTVLNAVKTFANASETIDTIMNKASSAIILTNLTGNDIQNSVDTIQSATKQFDALADGSEASAMKVADSMVAISRALGVDFSKGIQDMSGSVSIIGSLANQMGMDIDETIAVISAGTEKLRISGEEMARSLRQIMVRTMRIKGEGATEDDFKATEQALYNMGIRIRNLENGEMRDFMDVLQDIADKWDTMDESAQMALGEAMGGVRQLSQVIGSIQNMDRINELTEIGRTSNGEAMKAQEIWADSLEGKINNLINTLQIFWTNFIDSSVVHGTIDLVTKLVKTLDTLQNTFGSLGVIAGGFFSILATKMISMTTWKNVVVEATEAMPKLSTAIMASANGASVGGTTFTIFGVAIDLVALKTVALQAVLTMGLSFAIMGVVKLISSFVGGMDEATISMDEATSKANALEDAMKGLDGASVSISRYGDLVKQLEDATLTVEERKSIEEEIIGIKNQLMQSDSIYNSILSNGNTTEQEKVTALQNQLDIQTKLQAIELEKQLTSKKDIDSVKEDMSASIARFEEAKRMKEEVERVMASDTDASAEHMKNYTDAIAKYEGQMNDAMAETLKYRSELAEYNRIVELLSQTNSENGRTVVDLTENEKEAIKTIEELILKREELNNVQSDSGGSDKPSKVDDLQVQQLKATRDEMTKLFSSMGYEVDGLQEKIDGLQTNNITEVFGDDLAVALAGSLEKTGELHEMLGKINEEGRVTPQILTELANKYPEMGTAMFDTSSAQQWLTDKIGEMSVVHGQAIEIMYGNNTQYYDSILANGNSLQDAFNEFASNYVDINGEGYSVDVRNFQTLNDAKAELTNQLAMGFSQFLADYVGGNADSYYADLQNFNNLADAKQYVLNQLNNKMSKLQDNYNALLSAVNSAGQEMGDPTFTMNSAMVHTLNQIEKVQEGIDKAYVSFDKFSGSVGSISLDTSGFNPSNFNPSSGSSSKPSSGSSGKTDAEKEAEARIKAEQEANKRIYDMRKKLVELLKKKYEEMRDAEISAIDAEIEELKKQLDALENGYSDEGEKLQKLKDELGKWEQNEGDAYSEEQVLKLKEEIAKQELKVQIEAKEKEKETIEEKYDKMLENQNLYLEADKLLKEQNFAEITNLFKEYGDLFTETMGDINEYIKQMIDQLKADQGLVGVDGSKPSSGSSTPPPSSGSSSSGSSTASKGSRVKITDVGASIYVDSYTSRGSGTWRGAGVGTNDQLYIVNDSNGRFALSRTNNIGGAIGWIDKGKIKTFKTGGMYTGNFDNNGEGIPSLLHKKELVLNQDQTGAFIQMADKIEDVDKFLGMTSMLYKLFGAITNNFSRDSQGNGYRDIIFNPQIDVVCENDFDVDKFRMNITKEFKKELSSLGIKKR